MFESPEFYNYDFDRVPLNRDIFLMDVVWMQEYEKTWLKFFNDRKQFDPVGYIGYAAARSVTSSAVELSWYPNVTERFHEVNVVLPRDQFVACVGIRDYDEKPHLFVASDWFESLFSRSFSVFALVDAIGVKSALIRGELTREKLIGLRGRIDRIAENNPDISFISFGDSLLLKSNWRSGNFRRGVKYDYRPDTFIHLMPELKSAFRESIGLEIYAVLGQGSNAYYEDALLHISQPFQNHISLNSLGLPFAQLFSIDDAARTAIKNGQHRAADIYLDEHFYYSLNFKYEFSDKRHDVENYAFRNAMMSGTGRYYIADVAMLLDNFR